MPKLTWTPEDIERLREMRGANKNIVEIAKAFGRSKHSVSGILFRLEMTKRRPTTIVEVRERKPSQARLLYAKSIQPSKTPFAPDITCPDFAWDEDHCEAVKQSAGAFPVMPTKRRAA